MMKNLEILGLYTHIHTHTDIFLINIVNGFDACKMDFAGMVFYTQNLIRDG